MTARSGSRTHEDDPMAGHSKFKNIMHRKGRADAQRSKLFSKLSRDITVAAKNGMPDPALNPRLRLAVNNAKAESLPKDVITRAINKASGGDVDTMEEVRYEGRGPGGVGIIVEALVIGVVQIGFVGGGHRRLLIACAKSPARSGGSQS